MGQYSSVETLGLRQDGAINSVCVFAPEPCKSLATPRNYKLFNVSGVAYPSRSRCHAECSTMKQALAVPTTQLEYQCMIQTAGGFTTPFWTGVVISGTNSLSGIVNGTKYTRIGFFGNPPGEEEFKRHGLQEIFFSWIFGNLDMATNVYFHEGFYVSADDMFLHPMFRRFVPRDWNKMFCMCQGKQY